MNINYNYKIDLINLINNKIILPRTNYRIELQKIYQLINNYRSDYINKDYGNILYNIKKEDLYILRDKYQYLSSLEIFYNNNHQYFPNLYVVDMHGLYVNDMIIFIDILYYYWLDIGVNKVTIITGNGNRKLYLELIRYLNRWNMSYQEEYSYIKIKL